MARFALWVLAYGVAVWFVDRFRGGVPGSLWLLFWATALISLSYYCARLIRVFKQRVLWKLRRRLIVTYVFIAVVPILLIVLLVTLGVYITNGNFAAYLVTMKLREHVAELQELSRGAALQARQSEEQSAGLFLGRLQDVLIQDLGPHARAYPGLEITLRVGSQSHAFTLAGQTLLRPVALPAWLEQGEFAGIVLDQGQLAFRVVRRTRIRLGDFVLVLSQPFSQSYLI